MPEFRNPKDQQAAAERKPRLDLLEPAADEQIAAAMAFGAIDHGYGVRNYMEPGNEISLRTYIAAARRHIAAILAGEDVAPDSGLSHWAHLGATVHVVLGAMAAGNIVDDRIPWEVKEKNETPRPNEHKPIEYGDWPR